MNLKSLPVDAYLSFRSPYSYLALERMRSMAEHDEAHWNVKFVSPLAIRLPVHFKLPDPLARPYFFRDSARVAEFLGIPFRRPLPDPIVQDPISLEIAAKQPYIHRLTRLGALATQHGLAFEFAQEVMRMLWDGSVDDWDKGDHLQRAVSRVGLDLHDMERKIVAEPGPLDALIQRHEREQREAGHWGVPLFVIEGEPFFGQDRMDQLRWRLKQKTHSSQVLTTVNTFSEANS
ncbi:MAG: disulfide bond formation protein DsbA [Betaproteobacteria bacterium HGW-Betaproteobacteria-16]|nr:MAG: disulfide bond formation protein DsbA [Betaproteobacteria bacterium HGW-Betaproteobacteria-16]